MVPLTNGNDKFVSSGSGAKNISMASSACFLNIFLIVSPVIVKAYRHASAVIQSLGEEDINVKFLVQLDKLIRLLETPIFAYLRLQV